MIDGFEARILSKKIFYDNKKFYIRICEASDDHSIGCIGLYSFFSQLVSQGLTLRIFSIKYQMAEARN